MIVWVDEMELAAYANQMAAWGEAVDGIRGQALAALGSIGRWTDHVTVDRELTAVAERAAALARDHWARYEIAAQLLGTAWNKLSGPPAGGHWQAATGFSTHGDQTIEELEARIAALSAAPGFSGKAQAMAELRRQLREARIARLRETTAQYDALRTIYSLQTVVETLRESIVAQARELGLTPEGFMAAARAMLEGISPEEAGLDPLLFPDSYVQAHARWGQLRAERSTLEDAMWEAADQATEAWLRGDFEAEQAAWDEFRHLGGMIDEVERELDAGFGAGMAFSLGATAGYLDDLVLVEPSTQDAMVGQFLAQHLMDRFGDPGALQETGAVLDRRINTMGEALAFYNALPSEVLPVLPWLAYRDAYGTVDAMAPYARVLALASYSDELAVDGGDVVGAFAEPNAATWFVGVNYEPAFLRDAAVALVAVSGDNPYMPWASDILYGSDGSSTSYDVRVVVANSISLDGPAAAVAFLATLETKGLLHVYVRPESTYGDGGSSVGTILALAGTQFDEESAGVVAAVMNAIADDGADPGILIGGAAMISPHLTSLLDPRLGRELNQTELAAVLAGRSEMTSAFLGELFANPDAARLIFASLELLLLAEIDQHFDPGDTESLAGVSRQFGLLIDQVSEVYLDTELASAEERDRVNGLVTSILSFAADVALAGLLVVAGPQALALAILAEVGAAGATNLLLPAVLDNVLPTDNVEEVLAAGYQLENRFVDEAELYTLVKLHEAGLLELPSDWFVEGRLRLPTQEELREFEASITGDFPYADWINDPVSIGGAIRWDPSLSE